MALTASGISGTLTKESLEGYVKNQKEVTTLQVNKIKHVKGAMPTDKGQKL